MTGKIESTGKVEFIFFDSGGVSVCRQKKNEQRKSETDCVCV